MRRFNTEIIIPQAKAYEERHVDVFRCNTCDKYTARAVATDFLLDVLFDFSEYSLVQAAD
jgi:hypothetical protein